MLRGIDNILNNIPYINSEHENILQNTVSPT